MTEEEAKQLAVRYVEHTKLDYPVNELVAERFEIGWMVAPGGDPMDADSLLLGAPLLLVGELGIVAEVPSSVSPEAAQETFVKQYGGMTEPGREVSEIKATYYFEEGRGGRAVLVGRDGTALFANSSVPYDDHLAAFAAGKRS